MKMFGGERKAHGTQSAEALGGESVASPVPMTPPATPVMLETGQSDEGVPFDWIDPSTILNTATDAFDARRRELRVHGKAFQHVAEGPAGEWIYRNDR